MRAVGRRSNPVRGAAILAPLLVVLVLLGTATAEDEAQAPKWVSNPAGLEINGVSSLRIHPKNPDALWAHVHGLGIARSVNGGKDWEVKQKGIDPRHVPGPRDDCEISLDPRDEKVIWVVTKGEVYKSEDRGESWTNKSTGALRSYSWDKSRSQMAIRGVVVNPDKSDTVLAGTRTGGAWRGGLFESADGGDTWEQIAGDDLKESELGHDAWPIVLDPRTDKIIVVGGTRGFYFSDDRGRSWRRADPGEIGRHEVRALTEVTMRSRDIFLCDGRGLWGSRDGGKRWDKKPHLEGDCVEAYLHPQTRRRLLAVLRDRGLFVSDDARHQKWTELGHPDAEIQELLAHPKLKDILYLASPVTGLYVSKDDGQTLEPVKSNAEPIVPAIRCVAVHPVDADRAMALTSHGVAFLSKDRGETWARAGRLGTPPTVLEGDEENASTWWAAGHQLLKSPDNGATWEVVYRPEDPEEVILSVRRLGAGKIWLLLERSRTVAVSELDKNGNLAWRVTKPTSKRPNSWATSFDVDASNTSHLVAATRSLTNLWTPKEQEGGPWETWDGGKTWKPLQEGLVEKKKGERNWNRGTLMAIDPGTGLLFYAAEGLGLYARLAVDPKGPKPKEKPRWIEISPHDLPSLKVNVFVLNTLPDDGGTEVVVQAEGENDTRTFVRTTTARVLAHVEAAVAGGDEEAKPLWDDLPDAPARLADLAADPHVPGRYLAADEDGLSGVLAFGVPGARPAAGPGEEGAVQPTEVGPAPSEGLLAFSGGGDAQVRVWALSEGKVTKGLAGHTKEVLAIALSPDETLLATAGADRSILLFSAVDGSPKDNSIPADVFDSTVNALLFGPDSKKLYAGLEQKWAIAEIDLETGASRTFEAHTGGVLALAITPDGKKLVSGSRDRNIRIWDLAAGSMLKKIDAPKEVLSLVLSPDGTKIYAAGRGPEVWVYDMETGAEVKRGAVQTSYVGDMAISPDGTRLYVAGDKGLVAVDAETLEVSGIQPEGTTKAVFCVALSKDGLWIVAGDSENGLWMWRNDRSKPWWSNGSAHAGPVHALVLTPDVAEEEAPEEAPGDAPGDAPGGPGDGN